MSTGRVNAGESGQAAVEAAIVMPLFVFLILGILQLGLAHQARLLTKYAAYKAVRAGSLNNARIGVMEKAAVSVLLPMISRDSDGVEQIKPVANPGDYLDKLTWDEVRENKMAEQQTKYVEVTICGPVQSMVSSAKNAQGEVDFDDPRFAAGSDWRLADRTKLYVQVTFHYRMPVPFANMVIHQIARGVDTLSTIRLGKENTRGERSTFLTDLAENHQIYVLPIRSSYTMRMQSNFVSGTQLPTTSDCKVPFPKKSG